MTQTAAVFGSTGLVGNALLEELKNRSEIDKIYAYARRPPLFLDKKTEFRPFETDNFAVGPDINIVFCALGTTIKKAGSQKDFQEVDLHAVKRIAAKTKEAGIKHLVVVSSVGANRESNNFYLYTKGQMEEAVKQAGIEHTIFIRPSLLMGQRKEKRLAEDIGKILMKPLSWLMAGPMRQYRPVKARKVAEAMVNAALISKQGISVIENKDI
jgi:uncharacterized protein YbjT (DUF2867 family)